MDPISQGSLGAALAQSGSNPEKIKAATLLGCFAGLAPDLDIFIFSSTDPLLFLEFHRQFSHSLVFIP
ncbi:MAG: metal-dependent hydrolase, partial [Gammaproteobacteria bacterium]|nr:metal-dependent hydrolase [Gammaproteobacteria bacterium]